jgi:uncharacterized protein (AIM24 family)
MMHMKPSIQMETIFGDGSGQQRSGVMGALLGAGKRLITGESLFMTVFTNGGGGKEHVSFAAPYPDKILAMDLNELGGEPVCQKDSFLCAAKGVAISIAFQRKIGVGPCGGEGPFFASLIGPGRVWLQSLPFSRMADRIDKAAPAAGGSRREGGSVLGGLGDLLDGDSR